MGLNLAVEVQYKMEAYRFITEFQLVYDPVVMRKTETFGFSEIAVDDIIKQLTDRVDDPYKIDQRGANLCGPAAVMFCWLCKRPDLYVQYVLTMYKLGKGRMGSIFVQPGTDCKEHAPVKIAAVDWIALAALRDSQNGIFDFDSEPNYLGAITMPDDIEKWLGNIGFKVLENRTNSLINAGFESLKKATGYLKQGCVVCLYINATKIFTGPWWDINLTANHWIVMVSEPEINGVSAVSIQSEDGLLEKPIDFYVYTWGKKRPINDQQSVDLERFLDGFYGFIAAKYDNHSSFALKLSLLSGMGVTFP